MSSLKQSRAIALVILSTMVLGLIAACGGDAPTEPGDGGNPTPTATAPSDGGGPSPTAAPAFDAEEYFSGKEIEFVVGYSPGGGTDATARYLAGAWPEFIPGNPSIRVENLVPAPAEMNYMASAEPNGLVLAMDATAGLSQSYLDQANYTFSEFEFLGSFDVGDAAWLTSTELPYDHIGDARGGTEPLISPASASIPSELTQFEQMVVLLAHWLDLPVELKTVANANSTATRFLSFERKETNGIVSNVQWARLPQLQPTWLPEGRIQLFADLSNPDNPFPGNNQVPASEITVPNVVEFLTEEQRQLWPAASGSATMYSKGLLTTPGTPPEVVQAYRDAWDAATEDPEFVEGLNAAIGAENQFYTGESTEATAREIAAAYDRHRGEITDLLEEVAPEYLR